MPPPRCQSCGNKWEVVGGGLCQVCRTLEVSEIQDIGELGRGVAPNPIQEAGPGLGGAPPAGVLGPLPDPRRREDRSETPWNRGGSLARRAQEGEESPEGPIRTQEGLAVGDLSEVSSTKPSCQSGAIVRTTRLLRTVRSQGRNPVADQKVGGARYRLIVENLRRTRGTLPKEQRHPEAS